MLKRSSVGIMLVALFGFAACQSVDTDRIREFNPFKPRTEAPAPIRTGDAARKPATPTPSTPVANAPAALPPRLGGPDTVGIVVASCVKGCPAVTVLLDPDNYWQRTASGSQTTGNGRANLYADVLSAFAAQGFYGFEGGLNIVEGNRQLCPDYQPGGQLYRLSLSRKGGYRNIQFDTGCVGSPSADGAADAINAMAGISDFVNIVSGTGR